MNVFINLMLIDESCANEKGVREWNENEEEKDSPARAGVNFISHARSHAHTYPHIVTDTSVNNESNFSHSARDCQSQFAFDFFIIISRIDVSLIFTIFI
jgi:hypothetical protein